MPRVSSFYGITIWMYYNEDPHYGRPHFHARHGVSEASVDIDRLVIIAGNLPRQAGRLVVEWAIAHRPELRENWNRARAHGPLMPIEPLR
jgi:hypothetical protein